MRNEFWPFRSSLVVVPAGLELRLRQEAAAARQAGIHEVDVAVVVADGHQVMAVVVLLVNLWSLLGRDILGVSLDGTDDRLAFFQTLFKLGTSHLGLGVRLKTLFCGEVNHMVVVGAVLLSGAAL